jgi:hypothetical protein
MGVRLTKQELTQAIQDLDQDNSGTLSLPEFAPWWRQLLEKRLKQEFEDSEKVDCPGETQAQRSKRSRRGLRFQRGASSKKISSAKVGGIVSLEERQGSNWEDELLLGHLRHEKEQQEMFQTPYRYELADDPTAGYTVHHLSGTLFVRNQPQVEHYFDETLDSTNKSSNGAAITSVTKIEIKALRALLKEYRCQGSCSSGASCAMQWRTAMTLKQYSQGRNVRVESPSAVSADIAARAAYQNRGQVTKTDIEEDITNSLKINIPGPAFAQTPKELPPISEQKLTSQERQENETSLLTLKQLALEARAALKEYATPAVLDKIGGLGPLPDFDSLVAPKDKELEVLLTVKVHCNATQHAKQKRARKQHAKVQQQASVGRGLGMLHHPRPGSERHVDISDLRRSSINT